MVLGLGEVFAIRWAESERSRRDGHNGSRRDARQPRLLPRLLLRPARCARCCARRCACCANRLRCRLRLAAPPAAPAAAPAAPPAAPAAPPAAPAAPPAAPAAAPAAPPAAPAAAPAAPPASALLRHHRWRHRLRLLRHRLRHRLRLLRRLRRNPACRRRPQWAACQPATSAGTSRLAGTSVAVSGLLGCPSVGGTSVGGTIPSVGGLASERGSNIYGQHVSDARFGRSWNRVCTHAVQWTTIKVVGTLGVSGATVGLLRRRSPHPTATSPSTGDQLKCDFT